MHLSIRYYVRRHDINNCRCCLLQIVKGNHAFVRKGLNGAVFSAEPGNLYNKNSFKYSGVWQPD